MAVDPRSTVELYFIRHRTRRHPTTGQYVYVPHNRDVGQPAHAFGEAAQFMREKAAAALATLPGGEAEWELVPLHQAVKDDAAVKPPKK